MDPQPAYDLDQMDPAIALALLDWQVELGVDEPIGEDPVNRYDAPARAPAPPPAGPRPDAPPPTAPETPPEDPVALARRMAEAATSLEALAGAMRSYEPLELHKGARNFVFADGNPKARVMIIGEAPGQEEDQRGLPFVGRAGQLLDKMFAAIGLTRTAPDPGAAFYITNVLPWRPPGNRKPEAAEIAMMQPFLARHVELADPDLIVLMGNTPCQAVLDQTGILRLRGTWAQGYGRPLLPMTHPAYLLRNPAAKREAWADLLEIMARLRG